MNDVPFFISGAVTTFIAIISLFTYFDRALYPREKLYLLLFANAKQALKIMCYVILTFIISALVFASVYFSIDYFIAK